ncbi:23S rRNA (uracil(747)-C(5))-methyltransferase RlmC [Janibacter alkaliphilus]
MQCDHFDRGECGSCTLMGVPYTRQVADQERTVRELLAEHVAPDAWLPTATGPESGFRNKAKLAVAGTKGAPTFGILDPRTGIGTDLRDCGLYEPSLAAALPRLCAAVADVGLVPYDVPRRSGELKHLVVTASPDGELMARVVLRSPGQLPRLRRHLDELLAAVPGLRVVSVNLQPEHKAVLEGDEEIVLTEADALPMRLDGLTLQLRPRSFFQTSTGMARQLYAQASDWVSDTDPGTVLDLYCGVGGFALTAAAAPGASRRTVTGVEVSTDAVAAARAAARAADLPATFRVGDATAEVAVRHDLVVVNPPRRGIGPELAAALEGSTVPHVVYSSCHPTTLLRDLQAMPSLRVRSARLFDMFPQTHHHEVAVLLSR